MLVTRTTCEIFSVCLFALRIVLFFSFPFILATRDSSNLLAHEAAFALGQMQDTEAIPALEAVLNDFSLHPIVRHEAS